MAHRRLLVVCALSLSGSWMLLPASSARACSSLSCATERFLPAFDGALPASTQGVLWLPGVHHDIDSDGGAPILTQASALSLQCTSALGVMRDVPFHTKATSTDYVLIIPDEAWVVGERCGILVRDPCYGDDPWLAERFTVTPPASLPTMLGTLEISDADLGPVSIAEDNSACAVFPIVCGVNLHLALSDEAAPWSDMLVYETFVDDRRWYVHGSLIDDGPTGGAYGGRGQDTLFVANSETLGQGLSGATHTTWMRVSMPGSGVVLETDMQQVSLLCESLNDAGTDDAGATDAGNDAAIDGDDDAGALTDAGPTDGTGSDDGCGCSVVRPSTTPRVAWWMLASLAVVIAQRTLRRRAMHA